VILYIRTVNNKNKGDENYIQSCNIFLYVV